MHDSTPRPRPAQEGLLPRVASQLRQLYCGLHGHDALLHFGTGRLSLHCVSCGYESPGWDVQRSGARAESTQAPRGRVVQVPLVRHRRVA